MAETPGLHRRNLLCLAAASAASASFAAIGAANAQTRPASSAAPLTSARANIRFPSTTKRIDAGDLSVEYAEVGPSNGPAVLLLHGWPYDIHSFVEVAPLLAKAEYRVIIPYLRGYGGTRFLSAETPRNGEPAAIATDITVFMDALRIDRALLTDTAKSAIPELKAGFELLASAVERLRSRGAREEIVISAPRAFADNWLLPRIYKLRDRHPGCDLVIATSHDVSERLAGRGHVAIRYGHGPWPGWDSTLLFKDTVFPVCRPDRVAGGPPPVRAEDLRTVPLIHDESAGPEGGFPPWRAWLRLAGVDGVDVERGLRIDDPGSVVAAAVAGAGVALGRGALVARDLAEGRLMRPFGPSLEVTAGYYAVHRPEHVGRAGVAAVRDWLLRETAQNVGTKDFLPTMIRSSPLWSGAEERETALAACRPAAFVS